MEGKGKRNRKGRGGKKKTLVYFKYSSGVTTRPILQHLCGADSDDSRSGSGDDESAILALSEGASGSMEMDVSVRELLS